MITAVDRTRMVIWVGSAILFAALLGSILYTAKLTSEEPRKVREVLCIGIMHNSTNTANLEPRVADLCSEVGVYRLEEDPSLAIP